MQRLFSFVYGVTAYLIFLATFLYLIGFVGDLLVPTSVGRVPDSDAGGPDSLVLAILANIGLIGLFAVQHTIMARPAFKRMWTKLIPQPIERSTFVLATSAVFALMFWLWQPLPQVVWSLEHPFLVWGLHGLCALGWGLVLVSTFVIDHFDLFGLRQSLSHAFGRPYAKPPFKENLLYGTVRHPLMLGFVIAFWAAPEMTLGRLVFAATYTAYILVAIRIEERDLIGEHGDAYVEYRRRVPALLPLPRPASGGGHVRVGT